MGLSQLGTHIQLMSPRGPMSAPRSPSAIRAYSRNTWGGKAATVQRRHLPNGDADSQSTMPPPLRRNAALRR